MHQADQTTVTATAVEATLEAAIAQAVLQHQQEQAEQAAVAQVERQQAEQTAIAAFQLPFDDNTLNALPVLNFRFVGETNRLKTSATFSYQGLIITISKGQKTSTHYDTWEASASRHGVLVREYCKQVCLNPDWAAYSTPEQLGQDFLVWLHEAANTPTPALTTRATFGDYATHRHREKLIRAAMQGTLMGLTHTGLEAGACLQTALFAIETAEQVLQLMGATPLQRQVLSVLSLEQFTNWLHSHPSSGIVGSLDHEDHPVCRYVEEYCGVRLGFSNLALYDESEACVLGNDSTFTVPHELPLDLAGAWLPALLDWKTFDLDTESSFPTFTAQAVLEFLEPFQA